MSETLPRPGEDNAAARLAAAELFFQHSRDLFALFGPNGEVLRLNPAWETVTGWTVAELSGDGFPALIHPSDFPALVKGLKNAFEGRSGRVNARFRTKDGGWCWLQGDSRLTPTGEIASVMRDVTEEHTQQLALAEARRGQELLSKSAGIGAWTYEPVRRRVAWSGDLLALTGYADVDMDTPEKYLAICDPDDVGELTATLERGVTTGAPATLEHRMRSADGRWTTWRATYHTEPREGGVFALVGVSQNITELVEARDRAVLGQQQVRQIIEATPYPLAMTDAALLVTMASPSMGELFSPDGGSLVGRRLDQASPRASERIREAQGRALKGEVVVHAEEPIADSRGERRWIRWEVRPWRTAGGEVGGVLVYVGDITDLVTARREAQGAARRLKAALAIAEQASEAKASFLANMSHEIRTPMNGVLGVLNLLRREGLTADGRKMLEEAVACGHMLAELLNDVLDFSKIEAGRLDLACEPVQPDAIVEGVVGLLRPQADAKGLALTITGGLGGAWRLLDPVRVRQTLFNLVGNAVKFTETGEVKVSIAEPAPGRLRFEIEDTGVGIPLEAQAGLFQRFTQADASTTRRFGGSGLGLSITKRLAELMGGGVGFVSAPGSGSTFWIEVTGPLAEAPTTVAAEDGEWLAGLKILVVEDNAINRTIAQKLLQNLGASVETAENGVSGVAAAARGGFDLILMDIQMPDIDGMEATFRIRALEGPNSQVPIIALTANVLAHQHEEYLVAGMNGIVGKPIAPAALLAEIARIAGGDDTTAADPVVSAIA